MNSRMDKAKIGRAREEAIAWFTRETARLQAEIRQMEAELEEAKARETGEETESEAGE